MRWSDRYDQRTLFVDRFALDRFAVARMDDDGDRLFQARAIVPGDRSDV